MSWNLTKIVLEMSWKCPGISFLRCCGNPVSRSYGFCKYSGSDGSGTDGSGSDGFESDMASLITIKMFLANFEDFCIIFCMLHVCEVLTQLT